MTPDHFDGALLFLACFWCTGHSEDKSGGRLFWGTQSAKSLLRGALRVHKKFCVIRYEIRRRQAWIAHLEAGRSRCGDEERKDPATWRTAMPLSRCLRLDKTGER
ncbi:hypothetical protein AV530_003966 [Patagioenas fasciata monilis]|uniref:Secreted protein n=1 Tax=Patagioenas fasciata monilis TaxID=372326 RepID=A0A1V4JTJ7_PATFA|nr:hypothetical protein AV530_003966 [Patagioenas fasciata monilis]